MGPGPLLNNRHTISHTLRPKHSAPTTASFPNSLSSIVQNDKRTTNLLPKHAGYRLISKDTYRAPTGARRRDRKYETLMKKQFQDLCRDLKPAHYKNLLQLRFCMVATNAGSWWYDTPPPAEPYTVAKISVTFPETITDTTIDQLDSYIQGKYRVKVFRHGRELQIHHSV